MSKAASKSALEELHDTLATVLTKALDGEPNAALLNVARQFLKDNGIEAVVVPGTPIAGLQKKVEEGKFPFNPEDHMHQ